MIAIVLVAICATPAQASLTGFVSRLGTAVCWHADDYRYGKQLARAQRLWNQVSGKERILNDSQGCIPNYLIRVDLLRKSKSIQGTTYEGADGYKGEIILYKAALDAWPECRKWIALHEFGHALGLEHDPKYRTIMHAECPASYRKPVARPTLRDIAQYKSLWGSGPRGLVSDLELASEE